ncbi:MAG: hypothetical protein WKF97_25920 [Chitinophagaceae bacterium]
MKKIFILFALVTIFGTFANAQSNQSGVYLTQADFKDKKLSYASNAESETNKIRFNDFLNKPFLTIHHNGEKIKLYKDEVFAYQNKGKVVFTRDFESYTFAEQGVIWIFFKDLNVSQGKGVKRERKYYYSVSGKDEVIPLTVNNLKRSFPDKHVFHNFLDAQFRRNADLNLYDSFAKKFKVNHLLETTIFETGKP